MFPKNVTRSTDRLVVAAVRCAWSQWASIGALADRGRQTDHEIVDLESLLLGSLGLARSEPRLGTLATDWTLKNSELVSIARLRALLERPFQLIVDVQQLAREVATTGGDARWRSLVVGGETRSGGATSGRARRTKATAPRWYGARTLMLQLRRGLGVGVKPDLISILLGLRGQWTEVSTLADVSGYSVAGVRRAADDMANASLIETTGGHGRAYRASPRAWSGLIGEIGSPMWRRRADGFAFVLKWRRYLDGKKAPSTSELPLAIKFAALMTEHWQLWLEVGVTQEPTSEDPTKAWSSRDAAIAEMVRWFEDRATYGDEYDAPVKAHED